MPTKIAPEFLIEAARAGRLRRMRVRDVAATRGLPVHEIPARGGLERPAQMTRRLLAFGDALAATVAVGVVLTLVGGIEHRPFTLLLLAPVIVIINKAAGMYDRDEVVIRRSTLDEVPLLLQLTAVFTLIMAAGSERLFDYKFGPQQLVGVWLAVLAALAVGRATTRAVLVRLLQPERCLVVGDNQHLSLIEEKLRRAHAPAVVVSCTDIDIRSGRLNDFRIERMAELVERHDIHRVIIAPSEDAETSPIVRAAKALGVRVSILPRMFEAVGSAVEFEQIDGMTVLGVRRFRLTRSSRLIKRLFDLVLAGIGIIVTAPILIAIAIAIRLDTRGPIFFTQTRIGRGGTSFQIIKFRSMVSNAEELHEELLSRNEAGDGMFKVADDPRITRVGRWLRKTSLDELPQFFNVLLGDMSLVGPRPLVTHEDALVLGHYRVRLQLTPGMTGPWQVLGTTRVPMEEMVGMDYLYVANWSLWQDIKILARTVPHVLARRGL